MITAVTAVTYVALGYYFGIAGLALIIAFLCMIGESILKINSKLEWFTERWFEFECEKRKERHLADINRIKDDLNNNKFGPERTEY